MKKIKLPNRESIELFFLKRKITSRLKKVLRNESAYDIKFNRIPKLYRNILLKLYIDGMISHDFTVFHDTLLVVSPNKLNKSWKYYLDRDGYLHGVFSNDVK